MALTEGQVQLRNLVMGPGTAYRFVTHFNPFARTVRADQGGPRAWGHGSWSGAEWAEQAVVPMRLVTLGTGAAGWIGLHQPLAAAFAPSHDDLELRFVVGGSEYVMFGRPRMTEPEPRHIDGHGYYNCAFVATDPMIYSGALRQVVLGLPSTSGGLIIPTTVPLTVDATVTAGRAQITNAGTAAVGLTLRVDGSVSQPRITVLTGTTPATRSIFLDLDDDQWLDIDTGRRTVYLNGTASRLGDTAGDWPTLAAGTHELAFDAATYDPDAQLTASWRDAWYG